MSDPSLLSRPVLARIRSTGSHQRNIDCQHAGEEIRVEAAPGGFVGVLIDNVGTSLSISFAVDPDDARALAACLVEMASLADKELQEAMLHDK